MAQLCYFCPFALLGKDLPPSFRCGCHAPSDAHHLDPRRPDFFSDSELVQIWDTPPKKKKTGKIEAFVGFLFVLPPCQTQSQTKLFHIIRKSLLQVKRQRVVAPALESGKGKKKGGSLEKKNLSLSRSRWWFQTNLNFLALPREMIQVWPIFFRWVGSARAGGRLWPQFLVACDRNFWSLVTAIFGRLWPHELLRCHFSWQAQYLVMLECHFSWQAHYMVMLEGQFLWQAQHLVKFG